MIQHTPGPWRIDHCTIMGDNGDPVAIIADPGGPAGGNRIDWPWVYSEPPPTSFAVAEDNARLIAAAPDLLAALKGLLDIETRFAHWEPADATVQVSTAQGKAQAVVAKAEEGS